MYAPHSGGSKLVWTLKKYIYWLPWIPNRLCFQIQYRIGQLYMIARHSAEESRGNGDGVEVLINESCHDEVHGDGQYTEKRIYLTR